MSIKNKYNYHEAEEVAQWSRIWIVLTEDLNSIPSACIRQLTTPAPGDASNLRHKLIYRHTHMYTQINNSGNIFKLLC